MPLAYGGQPAAGNGEISTSLARGTADAAVGEKDLGLGAAPGLNVQECRSSNAAYRYRYKGLRMAF